MKSNEVDFAHGRAGNPSSEIDGARSLFLRTSITLCLPAPAFDLAAEARPACSAHDRRHPFGYHEARPACRFGGRDPQDLSRDASGVTIVGAAFSLRAAVSVMCRSREVEMIKRSFVLASLCLVTCNKSGELAPTEPSQSTAPATATAPAPEQADDPCAKGQPYRTDCAVVAKNKCFGTKVAACACEGCPPERCVLLEEVPPSASCE
jgi:hypothetical protein